MPNRFPNALPMTEKEKIVEYLFGVYRMYTCVYYISPISYQYIQYIQQDDDSIENNVKLILALLLPVTLPWLLSYQLVSQQNQYSPSNINKDFYSMSNLTIFGVTCVLIEIANYFSESPDYPKHNATLFVFATLAFIKSVYEYYGRKKSFVALTEDIQNNNYTIPLDGTNSRVLIIQETDCRSQEQYYNSKILLAILQSVAAYALYMYVNIGNEPNLNNEKQINLDSASSIILLFAHIFENLFEIGVLSKMQEYCGLRSATNAQQNLLNSDAVPIATPCQQRQMNGLSTAIAIPCQPIDASVRGMINERIRSAFHLPATPLQSSVLENSSDEEPDEEALRVYFAY